MKIKVTFELDLKDTHYNIDKVKLIPVCLQNFGQWFYKLHCHYLNEKLERLVKNSAGDCIYNDEMKKALVESDNQDLMLSEQLFNNYKVEGITEDGHGFEFTHQDPGYKEKTLVDGVETYIEPYDE